MNGLATLLIIMWIIVLIGICFIVKRLNTIEEKMIEIQRNTYKVATIALCEDKGNRL